MQTIKTIICTMSGSAGQFAFELLDSLFVNNQVCWYELKQTQNHVNTIYLIHYFSDKFVICLFKKHTSI